MRWSLQRMGWLLIGVTLSVGILVATAQPQGDEPPPMGKQRPTEEEEVVRQPTKKVKDPDVPETAIGRQPDSAALDLVQAARQATHPAVRELFQSLAVPHDLLVLRTSKQQRIQPITMLVRDPKSIPSGQKVIPLDKADKPGSAEALIPVQVRSVTPYEEILGKAVSAFLDLDLHNLPPTDPRHLPRLEQLQSAETALAAAVRFHESARECKAREGEGWLGIESRLRVQLRRVLQDQLNELVKAQALDRALTLGRRLVETYPLPADQEEIAGPLAQLLHQAIHNPQASWEKMHAIREKLLGLARRHPDNEKFKALGEELKKQAEELFQLAQEARKQKNESRAQKLIQQTEDTWPDLPELRTGRLEINKTYPILRVGVRSLPKFMSPALACTDTDRRAVELLFEGLVKVSPNAEGELRYVPGLAQGRPEVISLGRQIHLPSNAYWSNGKPVTPADIRHAVRTHKGKTHRGEQRTSWPPATGWPPAWGSLLEEIRIDERDQYRLNVTLKQGYIEPSSLMTFPILPGPAVLGQDIALNSEAFAEHPIGSGPFQFDRFESVGNKRCAVFLANLNYGRRADKLGRPCIREVQFIECDNPFKELEARQIDLALDLTAEQAAQIRKQTADLKVSVPGALPGNRRVYFLAVNHRNALLQNTDLRRALAHAIQREKLLDDCFRGPLGSQVHRALNSPFPAGSWALDSQLVNMDNRESLDLHDPVQAKTLAAQARKKLQRDAIKLTLKYPSSDVWDPLESTCRHASLSIL